MYSANASHPAVVGRVSSSRRQNGHKRTGFVPATPPPLRRMSPVTASEISSFLPAPDHISNPISPVFPPAAYGTILSPPPPPPAPQPSAHRRPRVPPPPPLAPRVRYTESPVLPPTAVVTGSECPFFPHGIKAAMLPKRFASSAGPRQKGRAPADGPYDDDQPKTAQVFYHTVRDMVMPPPPPAPPPSRLWDWLGFSRQPKAQAVISNISHPVPHTGASYYTGAAAARTQPRPGTARSHESLRLAPAAQVGALRAVVDQLERRVGELEDSLDSVDGRLLEALRLLQSERSRDAGGGGACPGGEQGGVRLATASPTHRARRWAGVRDSRPLMLLEKGVGRGAGPAMREADFPEGGARAWMVALGASALLCATMGYGSSFGVFQAYYEANQLAGWTPSEIAWIGSTQSFLMFAGGFLGGPLFDRVGAAWVLGPAALCYSGAVLLTSACTLYWHFLLVQGVLTGLSMGFLIFPAMAAVSQYFDKKRGLAVGLAIAGASVGAVGFPILLSRLLSLQSVGYGWTLRIAGFATMPLLLFACLTVRARLPPQPRRPLFLWSAFGRFRFVGLVGAFAFLFLGMFTPLFFLPSYGLGLGMQPDLAFYLVAIVNGASFFGRIIPGALADRIGRLNVLAVAALATGVVTLCLTLATTPGGVVAYAVIFGFCSGAIVSGGSVVFALTADSPRDIGTYIGMGMPLASVAQLVGPPINGVFLAGPAGYTCASLFSGAMLLLGGFVVVLVKLKTAPALFARV
ncbi:hypothetical protein P8C59_003563 [Phyllachora maydis]|uniref:Major facilitator superfamily (MFS) profile domain-containing protein n=1 Tax=Phyllachora maydis TaxID=1825666 RepID=A0AAD9I1N2_9PEZI|nr:hypothetical protein P8C59_003563 [Phyllachora maydis]